MEKPFNLLEHLPLKERRFIISNPVPDQVFDNVILYQPNGWVKFLLMKSQIDIAANGELPDETEK